MQAATFSMLLPLEKNDPVYEKFLLQYSLFTTSNLIIYDLATNATEDDIFNLFMGLHGSVDDYQQKSVRMTAMMLEDNSPQKNEQRGLYLDKLLVDMTTKKLSPKFVLASFINVKEFVLLYAIFEGALKEVFMQTGTLGVGQFLKEKDVISFLEKSLASDKDNFLNNLASRSPMSSFGDLEAFWLYFTEFRHLFFHSGGYVTKKWLDKYRTVREKLLASIASYGCTLSAIRLLDTLEEFEPIEGNLFYVTDIFTNIFRNYVVLIMESMYLAKKV